MSLNSRWSIKTLDKKLIPPCPEIATFKMWTMDATLSLTIMISKWVPQCQSALPHNRATIISLITTRARVRTLNPSKGRPSCRPSIRSRSLKASKPTRMVTLMVSCQFYLRKIAYSSSYLCATKQVWSQASQPFQPSTILRMRTFLSFLLIWTWRRALCHPISPPSMGEMAAQDSRRINPSSRKAASGLRSSKIELRTA